MLDEKRIIDLLKARFPAPGGIGDDAAIIPLTRELSYVVTKDLLVEDRHFRRTYFDPASLARKALHVNLSDVAAMGAEAKYVLLGLSLPLDLSVSFVTAFLQAFASQCDENGVKLIGGDTTGSQGSIFISVTAVGVAENTGIKYRSTASPGDVICVCGELGLAHAGLIALENKLLAAQKLKDSLLQPRARMKEGLWLGKQRSVTAMMDLSDGFYVDLGKMCAASGIGGEVFLDRLRPAKELARFCAQNGIDPVECMLAGGEDYGLLVAIDPEAYDGIAQSFRQTFGYSLSRLGAMTRGSGIRLLQGIGEVPFSYQPFSHFGETA